MCGTVRVTSYYVFAIATCRKKSQHLLGCPNLEIAKMIPSLTRSGLRNQNLCKYILAIQSSWTTLHRYYCRNAI